MSSATSFDKAKLKQILQTSNIGLVGDVRQRGAGQYQWRTGQLEGQAQIVPVNQAGGLSKYVESYMTRAKKSCKGEFASLPSPSISKGKAFETACISANNSLSSSLIFAQEGADIIMISHEISADDMDVAMDARDRIAEKL